MTAKSLKSGYKPAPCPICRKPAVADYRPFCSRRCADVDLAHWLRGSYVVPGRDGEAGLDDPGDDDDRTG